MRRLAALLLVLGLCACGSSRVHLARTGVTTVPLPGLTHGGHWDRFVTTPDRGGGDGTVVWYTTGPNKVNCYVTIRDSVVGTRAYCIQRHHAAPVTGVAMNGSGRLTICHGNECGQLPNLAPELSVGDEVGATNSPFDCKVLSAGVRCIILKTGSGFLIGTNGVQRVGHL